MKAACDLACPGRGGTCAPPAKCSFTGYWTAALITYGTQFVVTTYSAFGYTYWTSTEQRRWTIAAQITCRCRCL